MGAAGVEPHIENVFYLLVFVWVMVGGEIAFGRAFFIPSIGTVFTK